MTARPPTSLKTEDLARPLTVRSALPLRVAVYNVIAEAIRSRAVSPGALLPPEVDLGIGFNVSRTVMREALILLEEDGLIRTQRGVGRFVTENVPEVGIEVLQPIEAMLRSADHEVSVRRIDVKAEPLTDFTSRWLDLSEGLCRMWESVVYHDENPVSLAQEWISETDAASWLASAGQGNEEPDQGASTMLTVLQRGHGLALGPAVCHISLTNAGADRAQHLSVSERSGLLLMTQTVATNGRAFFVAKFLVRPEAAHMTVVQS